MANMPTRGSIRVSSLHECTLQTVQWFFKVQVPPEDKEHMKSLILEEGCRAFCAPPETHLGCDDAAMFAPSLLFVNMADGENVRILYVYTKEKFADKGNARKLIQLFAREHAAPGGCSLSIRLTYNQALHHIVFWLRVCFVSKQDPLALQYDVHSECGMDAYLNLPLPNDLRQKVEAERALNGSRAPKAPKLFRAPKAPKLPMAPKAPKLFRAPQASESSKLSAKRPRDEERETLVTDDDEGVLLSSFRPLHENWNVLEDGSALDAPSVCTDAVILSGAWTSEDGVKKYSNAQWRGLSFSRGDYVYIKNMPMCTIGLIQGFEQEDTVLIDVQTFEHAECIRWTIQRSHPRQYFLLPECEAYELSSCLGRCDLKFCEQPPSLPPHTFFCNSMLNNGVIVPLNFTHTEPRLHARGGRGRCG